MTQKYKEAYPSAYHDGKETYMNDDPISCGKNHYEYKDEELEAFREGWFYQQIKDTGLVNEKEFKY